MKENRTVYIFQQMKRTDEKGTQFSEESIDASISLISYLAKLQNSTSSASIDFLETVFSKKLIKFYLNKNNLNFYKMTVKEILFPITLRC